MMPMPEDDPLSRHIQDIGLILPDSSADMLTDTKEYLEERQIIGFLAVAQNLEQRPVGDEHLKRTYFQLESSESSDSLYIRNRNTNTDLVQITYNSWSRVPPLFTAEVIHIEDYLIDLGKDIRIAMASGTVDRPDPYSSWSIHGRVGSFLRIVDNKLLVSQLDSSYSLNFPAKSSSQTNLFSKHPSELNSGQLKEVDDMRQNIEVITKLLGRLRQLPAQTKIDDIY